ncbi:hypothetical protein ACHHYP_02062 [Achlya hypogyna]|uniref:Transmembrane protein n=1 Tax=Achlya hypogyna TaxID=1202772 RepID=A0A1V9ZT21_ACHHY|nr:hypothetical protein ACHHYP_02062 [Achlya hypogyna]
MSKPSLSVDTSAAAPEPPKLSPSQRVVAAMGELGSMLAEGAAELKGAAVDAFTSGNMVDAPDVRVPVSTSPLHAFLGYVKETAERHMSKYRRESTGATDATDDDDADVYYSDDDDDDMWEAIAELPADEILALHKDKPWHEAPLHVLRHMDIDVMFQLRMRWQRKLFVLFTGPCVAVLLVAADWTLAAGVLALYALLVVFGSMIYASAVFTGTLAMPEKLSFWDKARFEFTAYKMFLHLELEEALQFRVRAPRIQSLVADDESKEAKQKLMSLLVATEIDAVRVNIAGSVNYTDMCAQMSIGSVVVAATIYGVAIGDQLVATHLDFGRMNTKTFDALAIILPYLLNEELSVMLTRITLVVSWFAIFRHENPVLRFFERRFFAAADREDDATRTNFVNCAEKMCKDIGVGAIDMSSAASLLTAMWTINFLYQSYYVDTRSQGEVPAPHGIADTLFWFMVLYSVGLIALSYLPFSSWVGGLPKKDEKYQAMLSSCQSFLLMDRLSVLQRHITTAARAHNPHPERLVAPEEKRLVRQLRGELLKHLDPQSFVSYVLYSVSLAIIRLGPDADAPKQRLGLQPLRTRASYTGCSKLLIPIDKYEETEMAARDTVDDGDEDAVRLAEGGGLVADVVAAVGAIVPSLYEFHVLDHKVAHAFMDKGVTELRSVIENPLVRDSQIYWNCECNFVVLGVEIKVMEDATAKNVHDRTILASLYLVATTTRDGRFEIGHGGIFIEDDQLARKELQLPVDGTPILYKKVPGRARSRFLNRCFLAPTDEHPSCYHPDVVFNGAVPGKGTYVQPRATVVTLPPLAHTGSASHLSGDRYNSAKLSAAAKIFGGSRTSSAKSDDDRTGSAARVETTGGDRTGSASQRDADRAARTESRTTSARSDDRYRSNASNS